MPQGDFTGVCREVKSASHACVLQAIGCPTAFWCRFCLHLRIQAQVLNSFPVSPHSCFWKQSDSDLLLAKPAVVVQDHRVLQVKSLMWEQGGMPYRTRELSYDCVLFSLAIQLRSIFWLLSYLNRRRESQRRCIGFQCSAELLSTFGKDTEKLGGGGGGAGLHSSLEWGRVTSTCFSREWNSKLYTKWHQG